MTLHYRQMLAEDVPAALALRQTTRENAMTLQELENDYGITPASIVKALRADACGWLCESDSAIVGFCISNGLNGEIEVVAVAPDFEGRGIGKTLLAHAGDWLFSLGYKEIWLLANPDPSVRASGFYHRLGWRRAGVKQGQIVLTLGYNSHS